MTIALSRGAFIIVDRLHAKLARYSVRKRSIRIATQERYLDLRP
jgi:hypothetical protein